MTFRYLASGAIAILGLASPVFAEAAEALCGVTKASTLNVFAAQLEGRWTSTFKAGYAVAGTMVIPHPAAPKPETGKFEMRDGRLTIVPDAPDGVDLTFDWETGVDWSFDSQPSVPGGSAENVPDLAINDADLSLVAGCDVNELPRLVGVGSVPIDGGSMTFVLRLIVVNTDLIYGFQQVHGIVRGQSVLERRPFVMTR